MKLGAIFLFITGLLVLWWAFIRRPAAVVVNQGIDPNTGRVIGTAENINATANQAVANTIGSAGQAVSQGAGMVLGTIFDGIATSLQNSGSDSGSYGYGTGTGGGTFFDDTSSWFDDSSYNSNAYDTTL